MPVAVHPETGSIWFELTSLDGGANIPVLTIWDDGEVILDNDIHESEFIYPTLEEWEFLAQIVDTNIERLRKEMRGN